MLARTDFAVLLLPDRYTSISSKECTIQVTQYSSWNIFKELTLGQKDKKRMGKWIRQRFFLIAGRLVRSGKRFIMKLSEDWAYKDEYIEADRRLERLAWVT